MKMLRLTLDEEHNVGYLYFHSKIGLGSEIAKSVSVTKDVVVDLDAEGHIVGVEFLDVGKRFSKESLDSLLDLSPCQSPP